MSSPSSLASALINRGSVAQTPAVRATEQTCQGCGGFWEAVCKLFARIFGSSVPAQPLSNRIIIRLKPNVHEEFDWKKLKNDAEQHVQSLKSNTVYPINREALRHADSQLDPLRREVERLRIKLCEYENLVQRYQEQVDNYDMDEDDRDFVELRQDYNDVNEEYRAARKKLIDASWAIDSELELLDNLRRP